MKPIERRSNKRNWRSIRPSVRPRNVSSESVEIFEEPADADVPEGRHVRRPQVIIL